MSRAMLLAGCDRLRQFGAVVTLAALDLGELGDQLPLAAVEKAPNRSLLGLKSEADLALLLRRDAVVADKFPAHQRADNTDTLSRPTPALVLESDTWYLLGSMIGGPESTLCCPSRSARVRAMNTIKGGVGLRVGCGRIGRSLAVSCELGAPQVDARPPAR
jgi:hypothetical protein